VRSSPLLTHALGIFAIVVVLRLVLVILVPIVQDETYYLAWATAPDWGYFDHPPAVAWIGATIGLSSGSPLAGRLGTMLVAALAYPFMAGLLVNAGIRARRVHLAGLLLLSFNLCALVSGVLTTPDVALFTAWCVALHEGAAALAGRRRRWIGAGVAVGLGLLSKYAMVLIGPVFVWGLLRGDRQALRTPWPWLGAVVGASLFAPHLLWNARHDWVPVRFAVRRGFQGTNTVSEGLATRLPWAQPPGEAELAIGRWFAPKTAANAAASIEGPRARPAAIPQLLERSGTYASSVLLMWGAFLVPIVSLVHRRASRLPRTPDSIDRRVRPLLAAAVVVPLCFFALVSLKSSVEANWPAVYVIGAAPLLAAWCAQRLRTTVVCSAVNAMLVLVLAVYARVPLAAGVGNRLARETLGYRELAATVDELHGPIFADHYQLVAELNFHAPHLGVRQWPGIRRPSEYLRRAEWTPDTVESLVARGGLWLVTGNPLPPRLPGFQPVDAFTAHYCLGRGLVTVAAFSAPTFERPCRGYALYRWLVIRYVPVRGDTVSTSGVEPPSLPGRANGPEPGERPPAARTDVVAPSLVR
jgi:4-amino-4-deoxy-L-arabinose transferase-like glycosyltransferase